MLGVALAVDMAESGVTAELSPNKRSPQAEMPSDIRLAHMIPRTRRSRSGSTQSAPEGTQWKVCWFSNMSDSLEVH